MALTFIRSHRIAHLARLELSSAPEQCAACSTQLNGFFDIVEQMRAVDTSGVQPLAHPLETAGETSSCACARTWPPNRPARSQPAQRPRRRARALPGPKVIE
jgi:aspartyl/glutamyl-tRNA(Asn/Gln) amidotransferase C subunit